MLFLPIRNSDLFLNGGRRRQVIGSVSWSLVSYDSYIWKGNTNQISLFLSLSLSPKTHFQIASSSYCFEISTKWVLFSYIFLIFKTSMLQLINLLVTVWFFCKWDLKTRKCRVRDTTVPRGLFFSAQFSILIFWVVKICPEAKLTCCLMVQSLSLCWRI